MTKVTVRKTVQLMAASLCMVVASLASAQEALVKAETLVGAQSIPMSRLMTFEQAYPAELLDYVSWLALRSLDSSSAWSPKNRGWNLYRINVRIDLEEKLRLRWQTAGGTIRSLSQTPETSLAKYWADTLTNPELDEALAFYQSAAGKKFLTYQTDLRRAYYRGKLVFEQLRFDSSLGPVSQPLADLRRNWLAQGNMPPESTSDAYAFHAQALQRIFPGVPVPELVFDLAAGAFPGTPAMDRLNKALTEQERDVVRNFLKSAVAAKELPATKAWQESVAKTLDLLPLLIGDIRSLVDLTTSWRNTRADPNSLPRSIAMIDIASVSIPDTLGSLPLDEFGSTLLKKCLPTVSDGSVRDMDKFIQAKDYLKSSMSYFVTATPAMFVTRGAYGACVATTSAGYPVLGVDSFANSVYVIGMTEAENHAWFRRIAQEVAADGSSESLVVSPNGNAFEVSYAIDARRPSQLLYNTKFLLAGTFKPSNYRIVVNPAIFKSISATTTSGANGIQRSGKSIVSTPEDIKRAAENYRRNAG